MSHSLAALPAAVPAPGTGRRTWRASAALLRASWMTAVSYRAQLLFSLLSLLVTVIPMYFVAGALQPTMAGAIAREGGHYFGFLVIGTAGLLVIQAATMAFSTAIGASVASGTLEAMFATPAPRVAIIGGLVAYPMLWSLARVTVLVASAAFLGVACRVAALPAALLVLALIVAAYGGLGLVLAAMTLRFRTTGPLPSVILAATTLLGGVYYPSHVIPSWIQDLSSVVPTTYGLRAVRRLLLDGATLASVAADVVALTGLALLSVAVGVAALEAALRQARRTGSLGRY